MKPAVVVHADWSTDHKKRWLARAVLDGDVYRVAVPEPVGDVSSVFTRHSRIAGSRAMVMGFDFPIGIPDAYAGVAQVSSFPELLLLLGLDRWGRFFDVAERPAEISATRPFYPLRSGKKGEHKQAHLFSALGVTGMDDILRRCERAQPGRNAACSLFWTLGGNQVGRAAISGWRDALGPLRRSTDEEIGLWPFDGSCANLLRTHQCVVVETYPADTCRQLGLGAPGRGWSQRKQHDRQRHATSLTNWATARSIELDHQLRTAVRDGFGAASNGEDAFDAAVGLFGMLDVVLGNRPEGSPDDESVIKREGWIFGQ
jgi:hypothetical protein